MIKLKDLLIVNNIKYSDKVKPEHKKKMNLKTELFSDEMRIPEKPFPENSSQETINELLGLVDYNNGVVDKDFVKQGNDINKVFKDYCKNNNLDYDEKYYKQIIKESSKTILSMKYHYNRPRPNQLAKFYQIPNFEIHNLDSTKTPSYPSGHTAQGYLFAKLLGRQYPNHYEEFIKLAEFISESRIAGRIHYPSDIKFGKEIAEHLFAKVKQLHNVY